MMPRDVHPPRLASWLVDLFTPVGEADAIRGDLLEEFSDLASKSGFAYARRWYWRQSVRTIFHLIRSGFRVAPWSIAGVVVGGMLLVQLGHAFAGWAIRTGMELLNHHVFLYHRLSGFELFLVNGGMYLCRLTVSVLIGCIIALACKRREMLATITVSLVYGIQSVTGFWTFLHDWKDYATLRTVLPVSLLYFFGGLFAIVIGGAFVRRVRWTRYRRIVVVQG